MGHSAASPTDAKKVFTEKSEEKVGIDNKLAELEKLLGRDLGINGQFASMDGESLARDPVLCLPPQPGTP